MMITIAMAIFVWAVLVGILIVFMIGSDGRK